MRKRLLAGLLLLAILPGQAAAAGPGHGLSKAYWDTLTPAQKSGLVDRLTRQMQVDLAAGRATVRVVEQTYTNQTVRAAAGIASIGVSGGCRVEAITTPGTGDWVRAVAWTGTTAVVSRVETLSTLLEDGVLRKSAFVSTPNSDYAGATTAYFFTAWWDTSEWRVRSQHTAINNGVFLWNKVPCTAAFTL